MCSNVLKNHRCSSSVPWMNGQHSLMSHGRGTFIAVKQQRHMLSRWHGRGAVTVSLCHNIICLQAENEPENDGQMMSDLNGLKQMQKGLQGLLQEATEDMCSHPAAAEATLKVMLTGNRVVSQGVNGEIRNARTDIDDKLFLQGLYAESYVNIHEDSHICDGDTVAVLFEHVLVAGRRPAKGQHVAHLYIGHVQTMSWHVNRKDRTTHRVHLAEAKASLVCKWYVKYL